MGVSVGAVSEAEAVAALEHNLWDMWSAFGRGEGCTLIDTPELMRFETPLPYVPYNSVMRCRLTGDVDAVIDETLQAYQRREVPLMWVVHPTAQPSNLTDRLASRGLVEAEVCPGMVAAMSDIARPGRAPDEVVVEQLGVGTRGEFFELVAWRYSLPAEDSARTLLSIMAERGFGEPGCPTEAWVARINGTVVSKVILHTTGSVAGIYGVATRTEARGLGLAKHLTEVAVDRAREYGVHLLVLHSTPPAQSLYEGVGFRSVADFRLWSTPDTLHL